METKSFLYSSPINYKKEDEETRYSFKELCQEF
jgi:hypothetical protein